MRDFMTAQCHSKTSAKTNGLDFLAILIYFFGQEIYALVLKLERFFLVWTM
jgi:hypothetical protein